MFKGEPFAVGGQAFGIKVTAAKTVDRGTKLAKSGPFELGIQFGGDNALSCGSEVNGDPMRKPCCQLIFKRFIAQWAVCF